MYLMMVDDTEMNNLLLEEALIGVEGVAKVAFTCPTVASEFVTAHAGDVALIFVDYDMPGMNGIEFIRKVRDIPGVRHAPVVMITSSDQRRVRQNALEAGVTDFLNKPFDALEVRARAINLLALNKARLDEQGKAEWLAREVEKAVTTIEEREQEIVRRLVSAAEHRDHDTGLHVQRVASYVKIIASHLSLGRAECRDLALASTMHDVGKIAISDAILLKKGPLDADERALMNGHTQAGYKILQGSPIRTLQLAAEIALSHHERWDGKGYPQALSGDVIPLSGRITAVADVFDALVSDRPYKKGWLLNDAKSLLEKESGHHFDPRCVNALLEHWQEVVAVAETGRAKAA